MQRIKFKDMPYERPNLEATKERIASLTERLSNASDYAQAREAFLEHDQLYREIMTLDQLSYIRHSIDTRDEFYQAERDFWDESMPELQSSENRWTKALLASPFRTDFTAEYGDLMFVNAEIEERSFSEAIIGELQQENRLVTEHGKLIASAKIPFEGGTYTLSQLTPFKNDANDERRLAAWKAEGTWYKEHQAALDRIYDEMVHLRDAMGKKLGYDSYIPLGYDRMQRNCYGKEDIERFREAVVKYVVPLCDDIYRAQADRLGFAYPMSFSDAQLLFRSGNPKPQGTPDDILAQGKRFYDELSPETSEFFRTMLDYELMDVLSTEGKEGGGYCTDLALYEVPFIFANFNGTQGDVEVITHEAGHGFECYLNCGRTPVSYTWPTTEACEVHSMSMEFFAWPWCDGFFGPDTRKYLYSHLSGAVTFLPYGTMVDHFQHLVYERPEMTPAERHATWKELMGTYMPWIRLDGEIPFYSDGEGWQKQSHIYEVPFYYVDYCFAQTVALEFWSMIQEDEANAWKHYMAYTTLGGSLTFTELLERAELRSPFDEECLRGICEKARTWLADYDLTGIE